MCMCSLALKILILAIYMQWRYLEWAPQKNISKSLVSILKSELNLLANHHPHIVYVECIAELCKERWVKFNIFAHSEICSGNDVWIAGQPCLMVLWNHCKCLFKCFKRTMTKCCECKSFEGLWMLLLLWQHDRIMKRKGSEHCHYYQRESW